MNLKNTKRIDCRPSKRFRYGVAIQHGKDYGILINRILFNDDIDYYCWRDNEMVIKFRKQVHKKRFSDLVKDINVVREFIVAKNGKLTSLYPATKGWTHVNKDSVTLADLKNLVRQKDVICEFCLHTLKDKSLKYEQLIQRRKELLEYEMSIAEDNTVTIMKIEKLLQTSRIICTPDEPNLRKLRKGDDKLTKEKSNSQPVKQEYKD